MFNTIQEKFLIFQKISDIYEKFQKIKVNFKKMSPGQIKIN